MRTEHLILVTLASSVFAAGEAGAADRRERGEQIIAELSGGYGQPALEELRDEFPFLADAIVDHALGEVWAREGIDHRTRQLATVAAFAATGNLPQLKIHAGYALNVGVTQDELREIVYLTAVHAGFPRAIDAARTLSDLFAERWETGRPLN